jgi:hypothetical protein
MAGYVFRGKQRMHCGTNKGYFKHIADKTPTCIECRCAHADYKARIRGTKTRRGPNGRPPACGTQGGYQAHRRRGEEACFKCRLANAEAVAKHRAKLKERKAA